MESWTPLTLFWFCVAMSALTAVGSLCLSDKPKTIASILGAATFHGLMGGGLSMGLYEYFLWKTAPFRAVAVAVLYGGGAISLPDIRAAVSKLLGGSSS